MKRRAHKKEVVVVKPWRLVVLLTGTVGLFMVIGWRYYQIQIVNQSFLGHYGRQGKTLPRGKIFDRSMRPLATNRKVWDLYVNIPASVAEQNEVQKILTNFDHVAGGKFAQALVKGRKGFTWLEEGVSREAAARFRALPLRTTRAGTHSRYARSYPYGSIAAQQIGFVGRDDQGLEGLEYSFDAVLSSRNPSSAHHLRLTLDFALQSFVEHALQDGLDKTGATGAMALVLEAGTGAILVAAVAPGFDPNHFGDVPPAQRRNRIVTDAYEPGSTIKPFVIGRAWQAKKIRLDEILYCENGAWQLYDHTIHDAEPHGWLTPVQTIIKSSNICTAKIAQRLGKQKLVAAMRDLGFGRRIQNDLPGEARGILRSANRISEVGLATMSFGQGLSVTPLQLAAAYNALASGGRLLEPYIVDALLDNDLNVVSQRTPNQLGVALSPVTTRKVIDMLRQVVVSGTGEKAALEGIPVAGKTGTAQVPDLKNGGYKKDEYTALFAGLLPVPKPLYSVVVIVENPKSSIYGGQVAAPIFREIARVLAARARTLPAVAADQPDPPQIVRRKKQAVVPKGYAPNMAGMTLREALQVAQNRGINLQIRGQGVVQSQIPKAGKRLAKGASVQVLAGRNRRG